MNRSLTLLALMAATALSACSLTPAYERPALAIAPAWPGGETSTASAGDLAWRSVFEDPRLRGLIDLALVQNRDLRVAVANIDRARAQYRVQRASLLPTVNATASETRSRNVGQIGIDTDLYSLTVGLSSYEVDLFGRVRALSESALQSYFAVEENRRTAQISLIAEVATGFVTLAADQDLLAVARQTLKSREDSLEIIRLRVERGVASDVDLNQAQTLAEQARGDAATAVAAIGQDQNALRLLVGADIPPELLPDAGVDGVAILADLPAGLPSEVLTRRPDVVSAERALRGKNANIGAARAAFFPKITLTGSAGTTSTDLGGLFSQGAWSFTPQISLPLFTGGANKANLEIARADQTIAVAQYQKAIQTAFREVADALAVRATIADRRGAQERLVAAATRSQTLTQARYDRGIDTYLSLLDAQRTLYTARQTLVRTRLLEATNRVELYRSLGGGSEQARP